jgi:hypothetical protein
LANGELDRRTICVDEMFATAGTGAFGDAGEIGQRTARNRSARLALVPVGAGDCARTSSAWRTCR